MDLFFKRYGAGEPLLILHGLLGASGNWHTLSQRVFGESFEVYALDQRNHGRSPHSEGFDYPTLADDVFAFMRQHGLASAHLLGHSMGGKTAMQVALTYPDLVDRLIVVDIAPKAYPPHHTVIFDALRSIDLTHPTDRRSIDAHLAPRIPDLGVRQFLLKNLASDGAGRYRWKMNLDGLFANYAAISGQPEATTTFDGPTLFIRGGRSDYIHDDDLPTIRRLFPTADLVTIPNAGHWVHAEAPDAFAEAVMDFLA